MASGYTWKIVSVISDVDPVDSVDSAWACVVTDAEHGIEPPGLCQPGHFIGLGTAG